MLVVTAGTSLTASLGTALLEVAGSIAVGAAAGYGLSRLARHLHQGGIRLPLVSDWIQAHPGLAVTIAQGAALEQAMDHIRKYRRTPVS